MRSMPRVGFALPALVLLAFLTPDLAFADAQSQPYPRYRDPSTSGGVLVSNGSVRAKSSAGPDTFCLYGGPGSPDGKFGQFAAPSMQGWIGVDLSEDKIIWQRTTFCTENLNSHGVGNWAYWCGRSAAQEPGWTTPPGFGNSWYEPLVFEATMVDPSVGQTVNLDFVFNYDFDPGYSRFTVEYDSAGTWLEVLFLGDAGNRDGPTQTYLPPGVVFPDDLVVSPIVYTGNDYGGPNGDQVRLRIVVATDGAWSDEDGLWPTPCGAAMVDDLTVQWHDGVAPQSDFTDFEGPGPYSWLPDVGEFVGDFARAEPFLGGLDPCRTNTTPVIAFIDDGSCPRNLLNNSGLPPCEDTGGTTSPWWDYSTPEGWVVNYTGGLSNSTLSLDNHVWSPEIAWDLPGSQDDGVEIAGAELRFDVYQHLPLINGIFYVWGVRSSADGLAWTDFEASPFVYFGNDPTWLRQEADITQMLTVSPTHVQLSLGVRDLANLFAFPGTDATPSPYFDNVSLWKYRVGGPSVSVRDFDLLQDGFPQSGQAEFTTLANRQNADIRLDMARDIGTGFQNTPGDSLVVDVVAVIPGTSVDQVDLVWVLDRNPWFDDVRTMPAGAVAVAAGAANGWDQWTGEVAGQVVMAGSGIPVPGKYSFDPPDADFFHPGDVFRYYIRARDDEARETTLPVDLSYFGPGRGSLIGEAYDRRFTVRGLPSVVDDGQGSPTSPNILVANHVGHGEAEDLLLRAFADNGWESGVEFDLYTAKSRADLVGNGIGSGNRHGPTPAQAQAYSVILLEGGSVSAPLSSAQGGGFSDKSNDIGFLSAWQDQAGDRTFVLFTDRGLENLSSNQGAVGPAFLSDKLGVEYVTFDVRSSIDNQLAPVVIADPGSCFAGAPDESFVVYAGCDGQRAFTSIGPLAGAVRGHGFADISSPGNAYPGPGRAASVVFDRSFGSDRRLSISFPFGFDATRDLREDDPGLAVASRAELLQEILVGCAGEGLIVDPVPAPPAPFRGLRVLNVVPNPFNPRTEIRFELGREARVEAVLYNLRGARVRVLTAETLPAGPNTLVWDGADTNGTLVASGVYLLRVTGDGESLSRKVALVR